MRPHEAPVADRPEVVSDIQAHHDLPALVGRPRRQSGRGGTSGPGERTPVRHHRSGEPLFRRAAARDGAVYLLDTRFDSWIAFACTVAGRNLTEQEWQGVFGDQPYHQTCVPG